MCLKKPKQADEPPGGELACDRSPRGRSRNKQSGKMINWSYTSNTVRNALMYMKSGSLLSATYVDYVHHNQKALPSNFYLIFSEEPRLIPLGPCGSGFSRPSPRNLDFAKESTKRWCTSSINCCHATFRHVGALRIYARA